MSTTSVVPAVLDGLLAAIEASAFPFPAYEAWPGPDAAPKMFFFGEFEWDEYRIPTLKDGRRQRQEDFDISWELWIATGESSPTNIKTQRDEAFEALGEIEGVLAEDPTGGTDFASVQHVQLRLERGGAFKFERGWFYRLAGTVHVEARLK